jgi:hypothetical protein
MRVVNDRRPWMTITLMALVLMVTAVGGAVVIWGNEGALSFERYLDLLKDFAIAVGILGVGRGIVSYGRSQAETAATGSRSPEETAIAEAAGPQQGRGESSAEQPRRRVIEG